MLPSVHWGANPRGLDHIPADSPEISVLHHYFGSWKSRGGWVAKAMIKAVLRRVWRLLFSCLAPQDIASLPTRSALAVVSMCWSTRVWLRRLTPAALGAFCAK